MMLSAYRRLLPGKFRIRNIDFIVCDLDGTSLRKDSTLSAPVQNAITELQEKGIGVLFASGRSESFMQTFYSQCKLQTPIISLNGCLIRTTEGTVLHSEILPSSPVKSLVATVAAAGELSVVLFTHEAAYSMKTPFGLPSYLRQTAGEDAGGRGELAYRYEPVFDLEPFIDKTVFAVAKGPFMAIQTLSAVLAKNYFAHLDKIVYPSQGDGSQYFMEIKRRHASKGTAMRAVSSSLRVPRRRIAAIGDYFNDREMCSAVGYAGAMLNADSSLKSICDFVTRKTNDEDGILEFLEMILKHRKP